MSEPNAYIQWKGTDACLDLRCPCGGLTHADGMFMYSVACEDCGQEYKLPSVVPVRPLADDKYDEWDLTETDE